MCINYNLLWICIHYQSFLAMNHDRRITLYIITILMIIMHLNGSGYLQWIFEGTPWQSSLQA